eukprot:8576253-Pyramimonas_sp.AAC.1
MEIFKLAPDRGPPSVATKLISNDNVPRRHRWLIYGHVLGAGDVLKTPTRGISRSSKCSLLRVALAQIMYVTSVVGLKGWLKQP